MAQVQLLPYNRSPLPGSRGTLFEKPRADECLIFQAFKHLAITATTSRNQADPEL